MSSWSSREKIVQLIVFTPAIYILTMMWLIPEGYKYVPATVVIATLAFLALKGWRHTPKTSENPRKLYAILILASTSWYVLTYKINDGNISQLRALASVSVYLALIYRFEFPTAVLRACLYASCFILSTICLFQFFILDINRATLHYNPIPFATGLAFYMAVACALAFREKGRLNPLDTLAAVLCLAAITTTGTRGVIAPALLMVLVSIFWGLKSSHFSGKGKALATFAILILALAGSVSVIHGRIALTAADLEKVQEGNFSGSIGLRIQFWKGAVELATLNPAIGIGNHHFDEFQKLGERGFVTKQAMDYAPYHYHNQYLDDLVKRGIPGLAFLLATLAFLGVASIRNTRKEPWRGRAIALIVMVTSVAGLTDVPLNHPPVIFTFFVLTFFLLPTTQNTEGQLTRR